MRKSFFEEIFLRLLGRLFQAKGEEKKGKLTKKITKLTKTL